MTSAAPQDRTSPSRRRAARLIRELGQAFMSHDINDELLDLFSATVQPALTMLTEAELGFDGDGNSSIPPRPVRLGRSGPGAPDWSFLSGDASPISAPTLIALEREADGSDRVVLRTYLGHTHQADPGIAHGGAVAAFLYDAAGIAVDVLGRPSESVGDLTVRFVQPVPVLRPLDVHAWLVVDDRGRRTARATAVVDTVVCAEATATLAAPVEGNNP